MNPMAPMPEPLSSPGTSTSVLEREETVTQPAEPGDHERFSPVSYTHLTLPTSDLV